MLRRIGPTLIAVAVAATMVCWTMPLQRVAAGGGQDPALVDTDDDFLPDSVEWVVMTSATSPDTDGDTIPDFVEVVQRGKPRQENPALPEDQEMRLVITGPQPGTNQTLSWLHVFVRLVNPSDTVNSFQTWIEFPGLPGLHIPLDISSFPGTVLRVRPTPHDGTWLHVAVPLVSVALLQALMPCSLHAESTLADRTVDSTVNLVNIQNTPCSIVPFNADRYVLQSLSPPVIGGGGQSNRVCLLELSEVGSGPGGTIYEVVDAYCDDCNEMECGPGCAQSIGWILTLPGGLDSISISK